MKSGRARLGCLCIGLLGLLAARPAAALPATTFLIAVGNNHGDAGEEELLYAERDARELSEVLHRTGGIASSNTQLLLGEDVNAVRRTLIDVNARLRSQNDPQSAVLFYYSGHADAQDLHLGGSRLPFAELRGLMEGSPAGLRLLIVDSCRSGGVSRVKGVRAGQSFEITLQEPMSAQGLVIMTSSAASESSQESDALKGSFFSHHLMSALRGAADRDGDGQVTLTEAYSYTYEQTLRSTGRTLEVQHPTYSYDVKGRGEVVLSQPGRLDRGSARLRLPEPGLYLISEEHHDGPLVAEVTAQRSGTVIALPPRRYFVQYRAPREFREYEVLLAGTSQIDLANQPYRSVAYDRLVRRRGTQLRSAHGLGVLGALRGEVLPGEGVTGNAVLRYGADLRWLSTEVRLRVSSVETLGDDGRSPRRHTEVGLGLVVQRYVDLPYLSIAFGLLIEGTLHIQDFEDPRPGPERHSLGLAVGALLAVERQLYRGLMLRVEGAPLTPLLSQAMVAGGAQTGTQLASPLTYWLGGGFLWRF
jgi:hypothetical protein